MPTVTADSNVYISALVFGGKPLQLLERALAGEVRLMISQEILDETLGVLSEKFHLSVERIAFAREYILGCTELAVVTRRLNARLTQIASNSIAH